MTLLDKAAAALGIAWSPEDADRSTRATASPERLRSLSSRLRDTPPTGEDPQEDTVPGTNDRSSLQGDRQMLWVEGVGGFLLCTADEVVLGQPVSPNDAKHTAPTIGILGDLSRRHASIARSGGGYIVTPIGPTELDGKPIDSPAALGDRALLTLGGSVQVRFCRPHALSATARLEIESHHRTAPSSDAVLLMAESCVLGPKPHSHVRCPAWEGEAILFRGAGGLLCRSESEMQVEGRSEAGPVAIRDGVRIEGQDFALSVEHVAEA